MPSFALPSLLSSLLSSLGVPAKTSIPVEAIALLGFLSVLSLAALFKRLFFSGPLRLLTDPELWVRLPLVKREEISPDTRRFTFKLPLSYMVLGLPVGQHISFRHEDGGGNVAVRSYTPTTGDEVPGQVSFVIKVYFGEGGVNANARFPEGGKMTQYLESLKIGDSVQMRGPKGTMTYLHKAFKVKGTRKVPEHTRKVTHLNMIAGGTGITPMLQVITHALVLDSKDKTTTVSLLYANQTEADILVRGELEALEKAYPDRFKLHYTVDKAPAKWKYSEGFIDEPMLKKHLKGPGEGVQVLICGPPPMIKFACLPNLEKLGFKEDNIFVF